MRRATQRRASFRSPCIPPSPAVREAKSCLASFTPRWLSLWVSLASFYGGEDNVLVGRLRARKPRSRKTIDRTEPNRKPRRTISPERCLEPARAEILSNRYDPRPQPLKRDAPFAAPRCCDGNPRVARDVLRRG